MIDPRLLASTPFRSKTAFDDLIGTTALIFTGLLETTTRLTATSPRRYPVDASGQPRDLLQTIESQCAALARALGISAPPDLQSYDLSQATDFASWTFTLSNELSRLKTAAGIV